VISTLQESTAAKRERVIQRMKERHRTLDGQTVIGVQVFPRVGQRHDWYGEPWLEHWHVIYSGGDVRTYERLEPSDALNVPCGYVIGGAHGS
jgi:uncharacterized protein YbjQ (UPF0145 family)